MGKEREVGIRLSVKDKELIERALKSVGAEGQAAFKRIQNAAAPVSGTLLAMNNAVNASRNTFITFARGTVAVLAPLLTMSAAINGVKAALESFGAIADQSKSAGIDPEYFQGVGYAAKLAGIEFEETAAALATYAKNAGDAAAGRGRMVTALKALDPELLVNIQRAASQEERIRLATDALEKLQSTAQKAALSNALFGNADFWKGLEGGSKALDETIAKARDMGIIVDREMIAKADELGDKFDTVTQIIDVQLKQALINLGPVLVGVSEAVAGIAKMLADVAKWLTDQENGPFQSIEFKSAKQLKKDIAEYKKMLAEDTGNVWTGGLADRRGTEAQLAAVEAELASRTDPSKANLDRSFGRLATTRTYGSYSELVAGMGGGEGGGPLPPSDEAKRAIKEAEALVKRAASATEEYATTIETLRKGLALGGISASEFNRAAADAALKYANAADTADEYAAALAKVREAHAKGLITERQFADTISDLTAKRLEDQNTWLSGIELGLLKVKDSAKDVAKDVAGAVSSWTESLGDMIAKGVQTGKFAWQDMVKSILADIAKLATKQLITAPLAGLLGSLFGGGNGFAPATGYVPSFGASWETGGWTGGTRGKIAGAVHGEEFVVKAGPAAANRAMLEALNAGQPSGGGGNLTIAPVYQISNAGMSEAQLLGVLKENNKAVLQQVPAAWKKAWKYGAFG